jgi:hypothetical protein
MIGELSFGQSFGALQSRTIPEYVHDLDNAIPVCMLDYNLPLLAKLLRKIPHSGIQHYFDSHKRVNMVLQHPSF